MLVWNRLGVGRYIDPRFEFFFGVEFVEMEVCAGYGVNDKLELSLFWGACDVARMVETFVALFAGLAAEAGASPDRLFYAKYGPLISELYLLAKDYPREVA